MIIRHDGDTKPDSGPPYGDFLYDAKLTPAFRVRARIRHSVVMSKVRVRGYGMHCAKGVSP